MSKLAIHGGQPLRNRPFPRYVTIGAEEKAAVAEVLDSANLSGFVAVWGPDFFGGPRVRGLEDGWAQHFGVKHAVAVNSATSGLYAAIGAAGVGPGDEVIVSPYTMTASATAPLIYGAVPVFADIDPETFCITVDSIRERISSHTRAVIVVDLFGHPADMGAIMAMAEQHGLTVIEDAAQAPGATLHGRYAGTTAHMGVFSLNYHKLVHCGEGGIVVTDDARLAERLQLIRNHGEVVVEDKGVANIVNLVGFNYRMTEIEAAIAAEQLKKLEDLLSRRISAADHLTARLAEFSGIAPPVVRDGVRHAYYLYAMRYDADGLGIPRDRFVSAAAAEGIPLTSGYVRPIYWEPLYQRRIAFGKDGFPFTFPGYAGNVSYKRGLCPVTERMYTEELMLTNVCHAGTTTDDLDDVVRAFDKVLAHIDELKV